MEIVSFVILHYKDLETTDICVQSILRMRQRERIRIVIVDNDVRETSKHRQKIQDKYAGIPEVTILQVRENGGFSYANNLGFAYAKHQQGAAFILVLNNDIEFVQKDFLDRLDRAYREHPCGVIGPDVIRKSSGEHQNPLDTRLRTREEAEYTRRMNLFALKYYNILYPLLYWKNRRDEEKNTSARKGNDEYYQSVHEDIVPFGAILIYTPEFTGQEDKAFWPETNFYYEEYILACRCRKNHYRIVYVPELKALHESGVATRKSYGSEKKRTRFVMERVAAACGIYLDYLGDTGVSPDSKGKEI